VYVDAVVRRLEWMMCVWTCRERLVISLTSTSESSCTTTKRCCRILLYYKHTTLLSAL